MGAAPTNTRPGSYALPPPLGLGLAIATTSATMQAAIGCLRVSTAQQGRNGLGLAAQRSEIERFGEREGFSVKSWYQRRMLRMVSALSRQMSSSRAMRSRSLAMSSAWSADGGLPGRGLEPPTRALRMRFMLSHPVL